MEGYNSYRMEVPPPFQEVFSHFYFAQNTTGEAVSKTFLPHYQTIMIFSFGTPPFISKEDIKITIDTCIVLGPIKSFFHYTMPPNSDILVCNFLDDAFFRFFRNSDIPCNAAIHPDRLLNQSCFTDLWSELREMNCSESRIKAVLDFCQPYLRIRNDIAGQLAGCEGKSLNPIKEISSGIISDAAACI